MFSLDAIFCVGFSGIIALTIGSLATTRSDPFVPVKISSKFLRLGSFLRAAGTARACAGDDFADFLKPGAKARADLPSPPGITPTGFFDTVEDK
jgi:hypothetical protein